MHSLPVLCAKEWTLYGINKTDTSYLGCIQLFSWLRHADIVLPVFNCLMPLPSAPGFRLPVSQSPAKIVIAAGGEIWEGQDSGVDVAHCGAVCCWRWVVHTDFVIICAWCDGGDITRQSVTAAMLTGSPLSLVRSIVSCNQIRLPPTRW